MDLQQRIRHFEIADTITVDRIRPGGETLDLWCPVIPDTTYQRVLDVAVSSPPGANLHIHDFKLNGAGFIGEKFAQVVVIDPEGRAAPQVLTTGKLDHANPAWSPDGRYIAFSMSQSQVAEMPDPERRFVGDIGLVPSEGGPVRKLTGSVGPAYNRSPFHRQISQRACPKGSCFIDGHRRRA